jgi:hypothetical protein
VLRPTHSVPLWSYAAPTHPTYWPWLVRSSGGMIGAEICVIVPAVAL